MSGIKMILSIARSTWRAKKYGVNGASGINICENIVRTIQNMSSAIVIYKWSVTKSDKKNKPR